MQRRVLEASEKGLAATLKYIESSFNFDPYRVFYQPNTDSGWSMAKHVTTDEKISFDVFNLKWRPILICCFQSVSVSDKMYKNIFSVLSAVGSEFRKLYQVWEFQYPNKC